MIRSLQMAAVLVAASGHCFADSRPAVSKGDADSTAGRVVKGVLAAERDGSVANRARRLRSALRSSPQFAPAQWHSGRLKIDGEWVPLDKSIPRLAGEKTLQAYRALRAKTPKTLAGQLELATWCRQHKLYDQQRAHLTAALEIDPNHAAARKALGHVRMGPFWISKSELEQRRKDAVQAAKDLKRWAPTVTSIRDALTGNNRTRYEQALKRLNAIDDPAAIPAIELALAYESPRLAMEVIDYLGEKSSKESTLALARQGVFSPWNSLRKRVAERLKNRRYEDFVPHVLAMTSTPLHSKQLLYVDRSGSLYYRHNFARETIKSRSLGIVGFDQKPLMILMGRSLAAARANEYYEANYKNRVLTQARLLSLRREYEAEDQSAAIAEQNRRSCRLLAASTGKLLNDDAKSWWRWWDNYTDSTKYSQSESKPEIWIESYQTSYEEVPFYLQYSSCLVAGTPVWTDRGPLAIETVQIGDRVLSQNVETGELAYKPVLRTTVRPQRPLLALEIGPRTVRMTEGHLFWISGRGWTKARDIKAGMLIHDVTGTTVVRPAGSTKAEPTYNLVVADFHTYFVGETKVLSHDITPAESTDVLVPGLPRTAGEKSR